MNTKSIFSCESQGSFFIQERPKNKYGQYFTPKNVANFMITLANIDKNSTILEPSCGEGVFLDLLLDKGFTNLTAYEIDKELGNGYSFINYESFISADIDKSFDLIIGNPPYIRWKNLETELKKELSDNDLWNNYFNSLCDYLYIFILKSIELLKTKGQLIFVCPEYWMNTTHSITLRNYMVENGYFEKIYHFNETPVFTDASVSIVIFKYVKSVSPKKKINVVKYYRNKTLTNEVLNRIKNNDRDDEFIERFKVNQFQVNQRWMLANSLESENIRTFENACANGKVSSHDLFGNTIAESYPTIGEVCDIGNGLVSGLDHAFQLNGESLTKHEIKNTINVIKAKNLHPFYYDSLTQYIFVANVKNEYELMNKYPNFYKKLYKEKDRLTKRYHYNQTIEFWQWAFLRNFNLFNSTKPRIFVPCKERISNKKHFRFSFVEKGIFPTQDVTAIFKKPFVKEDIHYILAFLNNQRVFDWLKNKGIVKGNIVEFSEKPISNIPFRKINWDCDSDVSLHSQISLLCKNYINSKDARISTEINRLFDDLLI